ncbi:MAG: gluconate kinase [Pseudonocardiaceae bacterium]|nr:MAG: gluconate kinase [Pseudonocardiaceae bacterium]
MAAARVAAADAAAVARRRDRRDDGVTALVSAPAGVCPPAEVCETHLGVVVLVGDRAFKVKKPVRTAFCDFSTPDQRRAAVERELRLNRRLAPDVYLGTAELRGSGCAEPVLVMRRMPGDRRLSGLVAAGADVTDGLRRLARDLAAFHAGADRSEAITADGGLPAVRARWAANLTEIDPFRGNPLDGAALDATADLAGRFLAGREALFARRAAAGRVVDGHGDLTAADVFLLDDGPRMLDCLDFDPHLRHVDGLDDAAFLAMDVERLGQPRAADGFLAAYAEFAGDPAPQALAHHFIAYRALVRAKVACLRHAQDPAVGADTEAVRLLRLTLEHLRRAAPRLVLVGGMPGTGKSTLAGALADRTGAVLLSSDRTRKEIAGLDPLAPAGAAFGEGLYTAERTAAVYAELLRRAAVLLAEGESVVLDASWSTAAGRRDAGAAATEAAADLVELRCTVAPEVAAERLHRRRGSASDATPEIATALRAAADPWPSATGIPTIGSPDSSVALALAAWERAAVRHATTPDRAGTPADGPPTGLH